MTFLGGLWAPAVSDVTSLKRLYDADVVADAKIEAIAAAAAAVVHVDTTLRYPGNARHDRQSFAGDARRCVSTIVQSSWHFCICSPPTWRRPG